MTSQKRQDEIATREYSHQELKKLIKKGQTIYTSLNHVSASGMSRDIGCYIVRKGEIENISWHVADALEMKQSKKDNSVKVSGCGMDMGYHIISYHNSLARLASPLTARKAEATATGLIINGYNIN